VVSDVKIHTVDHGHHHNQGGGSDHDAQQGEERPQLVAVESFESDPEGLAGRYPGVIQLAVPAAPDLGRRFSSV
jgi:hypothetical protein